MTKKQKLELTWIGKEQVSQLEPRILIEDIELSYHASKRFGKDAIFDNRLIFGDNLLALKALEHEFSGKVKCIFIDPPYNTGSAFTHYDDGIEHSLWLSLIRDRLHILKNLLADDGSLWITIDDNEAHYLKVLCDEVFGRINFVSNVVWQKKYAATNDSRYLSDVHDHVLVYAKNKNVWRPNLLQRSEELNSKYANPDNDPRGPWYSTNLSVKTFSEKNYYPIVSPAGNEFFPPPTRAWVVSKEKYQELLADNRIWFGNKGDARPYKKTFLSEVQQGTVPMTLWLHGEVGHNIEAKGELRKLFGDKHQLFPTPKPERLLQRILHLSTNHGDIVLDSFAGSGTTGAVAHKMGRRWIMVELGTHCETDVRPRLIKVIDGEDAGGITESEDWKGGGGFRYYKLAPSLLAKDKWDNWVINKDYDANMLAAAVCKHEGFTYSPSETDWWAHGYSTETDFIYVTTQTLTEEQLLALSEDVGNDRTLLVCCAAFKASSAMLNDKLSNLTLKKMPHALLSKCEWGKDDYSLNISKLPIAEHDDVEEEVSTKKKTAKKEADLFSEES